MLRQTGTITDDDGHQKVLTNVRVVLATLMEAEVQD